MQIVYCYFGSGLCCFHEVLKKENIELLWVKLSSQSCVGYYTDQAIGANHLTFIVKSFYLINIEKPVFKKRKKHHLA